MTGHIDALLSFGFPGGWEWVVILVIGLLVFGRRLPEVGRSLGRGIVEFKRGIKGIDDDIEEESSKPARLPEERRESLEEPRRSDQAESRKPVETTAAGEDDEASR